MNEKPPQLYVVFASWGCLVLAMSGCGIVFGVSRWQNVALTVATAVSIFAVLLLLNASLLRRVGFSKDPYRISITMLITILFGAMHFAALLNY